MQRSIIAAMAALLGLAGASGGGYRRSGRKVYSRKRRTSRKRKATSSKRKRRTSKKTARNSALDKGWW